MSSAETGCDLIFSAGFQRHTRGMVSNGFKELFQPPLNARTDGAGGKLLFFKQDRRDDHISFDAPKRRRWIKLCLPLPRSFATRRIFVADHEGRLHLGAESRKLIRGIAAIADSQHKAASALCELPRGSREPFDHEGVVAKIRNRMTRLQAEVNDHRLPECICRRDGGVERRIVQRTLRAAHPVHDTSSALIGSHMTAQDDTRIDCELLEREHAFSKNPSRIHRGLQSVQPAEIMATIVSIDFAGKRSHELWGVEGD